MINSYIPIRMARWCLAGLLACAAILRGAEDGVWPQEKANAWYDAHPWLVGANFIPSTAVNQLEMWQRDTFDPRAIDRELGWAQSIGFNTVRVFLHHLAWSQDPDGFLARVDQLSGHRPPSSHSAAFRVFRRLLESDPAGRRAAGAEARRP